MTENKRVYKCKQCGKEMTPIDYLLNEVCLACCKRNHQRVLRGL